MPGEPRPIANRWRRFADWDERPLRLDKFAVEDAENGFAAFRARTIRSPQSRSAAGRVGRMDGVRRATST